MMKTRGMALIVVYAGGNAGGRRAAAMSDRSEAREIEMRATTAATEAERALIARGMSETLWLPSETAGWGCSKAVARALVGRV